MKMKFFKSLAVYLCALMVLCSCFFVPSVGASAAGLTREIRVEPTHSLTRNEDSALLGAVYIVNTPWYEISYSITEPLPADCLFRLSRFYDVNDVSIPCLLIQGWVDGNAVNEYVTYEDFPIGGSSLIVELVNNEILSSSENVTITFYSYSSDVGIYVYEELGLYQSAWELFCDHIYGEDAELTPEMNLTLTFLSTIFALFVVFVPFLVVFFVIRLIFG